MTFCCLRHLEYRITLQYEKISPEVIRQELIRIQSSILKDKDGNLWMGASGGLFRFDGKSFVNVRRIGPWK